MLKSKRGAAPVQNGKSEKVHPSTEVPPSENAQPSTSKSNETQEAKRNEESEAKQAKINAHIKKLESMLRKIDRKIRELELESDYSDGNDEESPYILEDKYKRRAVKIHKKIQELRKVRPYQAISVKSCGFSINSWGCYPLYLLKILK